MAATTPPQHDWGGTVEYDTIANFNTPATAISLITDIDPPELVVNVIVRKYLGLTNKIVKKMAGSKDPGDWVFTAEFDAAVYAVLRAAAVAETAYYWRIKTVGTDTFTARGFISKLKGPKHGSDDRMYMTWTVSESAADHAFTAAT